MSKDMDKKLDSITITEEEAKKIKGKKSPIPTYVRTKKTKPVRQPGQVSPDQIVVPLSSAWSSYPCISTN